MTVALLNTQRNDLKKALDLAKLSGLVRPAPTCSGTIQGCFKSLRAANNVLNGLVSQRDFTTIGNTDQREKRPSRASLPILIS